MQFYVLVSVATAKRKSTAQLRRRQLTWNRYRGKDLRGACATATLHRITHLQPGECQQHSPGISEVPSVGAICRICRIGETIATEGCSCTMRVATSSESIHIAESPFSLRKRRSQTVPEALTPQRGFRSTVQRCPLSRGFGQPWQQATQREAA